MATISTFLLYYNDGREEEKREKKRDIDNEEDEEEEQDEVDVSDLPAELKMDEYDDSESDDDVEVEAMAEEDDEYAIMEEADKVYALEVDSDDEDAEDDEIRPTDNLLVVAMTEDEYSHLEIQLMTEDGDVFVHHDIALPEFPLCLAWTDCPPFQTDGKFLK